MMLNLLGIGVYLGFNLEKIILGFTILKVIKKATYKIRSF